MPALYKSMFLRPGFPILLFASLCGKTLLSKSLSPSFSTHFLNTEPSPLGIRSPSGQYHEAVRISFLEPSSPEKKEHGSDFERMGTAVPI